MLNQKQKFKRLTKRNKLQVLYMENKIQDLNSEIRKLRKEIDKIGNSVK